MNNKYYIYIEMYDEKGKWGAGCLMQYPYTYRKCAEKRAAKYLTTHFISNCTKVRYAISKTNPWMSQDVEWKEVARQ